MRGVGNPAVPPGSQRMAGHLLPGVQDPQLRPGHGDRDTLADQPPRDGIGVPVHLDRTVRGDLPRQIPARHERRNTRGRA